MELNKVSSSKMEMNRPSQLQVTNNEYSLFANPHSGGQIQKQKFDQENLNQDCNQDMQIENNWWDIRLTGNFPEKRGYHSSWSFQKK